MEYLVTMTTRVPDGTSTDDVNDVRAREAAHTRELAAQGRVLRLWRPPLAPGEWRTIGLFAAADAEDLERTLASMPLRVWRTDQPVALGEHPNDPGPGEVSLEADEEEFLVTFLLDVPDGTPAARADEQLAREADHARALATEGHLIRLWALSDEGHSLGLWQAAGPEQLHQILLSLPLADWLTIETLPLTHHPSDPATDGRDVTPRVS